MKKYILMFILWGCASRMDNNEELEKKTSSFTEKTCEEMTELLQQQDASHVPILPGGY